METPGGKKWLGFAAMCRRGSDGKMFFYKWGRAASGGFVMWVYESEGGQEWICSTGDKERLIHDLDKPSRRMEWEKYGDALLTWQGRPLSDLKGRNVRLRFRFRDARIYSLKFSFSRAIT